MGKKECQQQEDKADLFLGLEPGRLVEPLRPRLNHRQAALDLGFVSRWLWMRIRLVWNMPFDTYIELDGFGCVERLARNRLILAGHMSVNVFQEFPRQLDLLARLLSVIIAAHRKPDDRFGFNLESYEVPGRSYHLQFCDLVDSTFVDGPSELRSLYELGKTLGDYVVSISEDLKPRRDYWGTYLFPLDLEDAPDFYPIVMAASEVAESVRDAVPLVKLIADQKTAPEAWARHGALRAILAASQDHGNFIASTPVTHAEELVVFVYEEVIDALGDLPRSSERLVPQWDAENRVLKYGGEIVRECREASNAAMIPILAAFQEEGWPRTLPYTRVLSKGKSIIERTNVHDKLKQLNTGLERLQFTGDGRGTAICWKLREKHL